jgi:hypothetical protein
MLRVVFRKLLVRTSIEAESLAVQIRPGERRGDLVDSLNDKE